ncbi:C_GCAxxG_C_C family probable redox protein [Desulfonatronum thiosulfatophilum]|uniref:C_GCAxxG_C_C family probable redox protein n=1 Tax=Desulfonatronum thiosulfatophilum TaxID=617002 RepID=A0A1G6DVW8_9BACT|nr:C-GCAxxG-C-C family (seleno)protein [Desulfonatronum thiosulfatophilum]SDB49258.1 C_GCAxxG_C_C family probable redox protein [Desulfonatronum thiosulfatophilum]
MKTDDMIENIRLHAEQMYRAGEFYCSEAVVKAIKDHYLPDVSDDVIAAASGFPMGVGGAKCICGAVSGGVMALGLVFGRKKAKDRRIKQCMNLAKELHDTFKDRNKALCCRVLTKKVKHCSVEHLDQCTRFTGEVAADVARIIERERRESGSFFDAFTV